MPDIIGQITTPGLQPGSGTADKQPGGTIENPPSELGGLRPGESLLLQLADRGTLSSLASTIKVYVNNKLLELPLTLSLDKSLTIPPDIKGDVVLQVTGNTAEKINFKIVTIDGQAAEKFITPKGGETVSAPTAAIVKGETIAPNLEPIKLQPILTEAIKNTDIPQNIKQLLIQNLPDTQISAIVDSWQQSNGGTVQTGGKEFISALQEGIKNFVSSLPSAQEGASLPSNVQTQVKELITSLIQPLLNKGIPAEVTIKGEGKIAVLSTSLGDIFTQTPIKLPEGTKLQVVLKELLSQPQGAEPYLQELDAGRKLLEGLISPKQIFEPKTPNLPAQDLLKVLEPLKQNQTALHQQITAHIPTEGAKMLSNMVSYMKAASSGNLSDWLGQTTVEKLQLLGAEGQETLQRLTDFVVQNRQETPLWRQVEIPFLSGGLISKIRVAIKKNQDEEEQNKDQKRPNGGTRFVIDTSFSRLGDFQFDGFSLKQERRFDLIIRTQKEQPQGLIAEIMRLFKNGLHQVDYVGNIKIHVKEKFIKVCEDRAETTISRDGIYI